MNQTESKNKTKIPKSEMTWDTFYPSFILFKQKAKLKKKFLTAQNDL